jgi:hypothetical protein
VRDVKAAQAKNLKRQLGLDKPLPLKYLVWLVGNDWMKVDADGVASQKVVVNAVEFCEAASVYLIEYAS